MKNKISDFVRTYLRKTSFREYALAHTVARVHRERIKSSNRYTRRATCDGYGSAAWRPCPCGSNRVSAYFRYVYKPFFSFSFSGREKNLIIIIICAKRVYLLYKFLLGSGPRRTVEVRGRARGKNLKISATFRGKRSGKIR